jgi:hypothetical protein
VRGKRHLIRSNTKGAVASGVSGGAAGRMLVVSEAARRALLTLVWLWDAESPAAGGT